MNYVALCVLYKAWHSCLEMDDQLYVNVLGRLVLLAGLDDNAMEPADWGEGVLTVQIFF